MWSRPHSAASASVGNHAKSFPFEIGSCAVFASLDELERPPTECHPVFLVDAGQPRASRHFEGYQSEIAVETATRHNAQGSARQHTHREF